MLAALAAAIATADWLPAQDGLVCSVRTIDGRAIDGRVRIDEGGRVTVAAAGGAGSSLELGDLLSLDCSGTARPGPAWDGGAVFLRSGAEIPFAALRAPASGSAIGIELPCKAAIEIAIGMIAAIRPCAAGEAPPSFRECLENPAETSDLLYVERDGKTQRFPVRISSFDGANLHFSLRDREYDVGLDRVRGVVFGRSSGFAPDRQPRPRALVSMTTGERLEGCIRRLDSICRLSLDEGALVDLPAQGILRIDVQSDKVAWLSEMRGSVEQVPAFDRTWPITFDRTPFGGGIVLGGKTHERGICMIPRARITYDLGGRYDWFDAVIGIDDRGGPDANAVFRVFADGRMIHESQGVTLSTKPLPLRLALGRCKTLAIETDFGADFDLGDLCVFADARVIRN
ncbi:MAG: hypothetical protein Fur0037_04200 [Planctomycetota bacterium]